ncbi:hypothetical protein ACQCSV_00095 [Pseudarthrobacter sp. S3]|uniref:hypothetical protein n=1 Tax=Pseudarthrobacter sp. S3 TaxID=3418419 RepID=UPI003CFB6E15
MRPSPYDRWGACPILGWPRVRTCHSSPNCRSHGVFSRSVSGAHGFKQRPDHRFGGGNPGGNRHPDAGACAGRGPGPGPGPGDSGAPNQPESRDDG